MATSNAPNAPANIGDTIVFRENPFYLALTLPAGYAISAPVTAELWFRDEKQLDQLVPVTVDGQRISLALTVVQLRALVKAKLYILFAGNYKFVTALTATMGGAIPTSKEITVTLDTIGEVLVATYNDPATVGIMQDLLTAGKAEASKAKVSEDKAYQYMQQSAANASGAVDPAGTFNASTGVASQAQSATYPAETFTPTVSSTKEKGYLLDINVAGTTNITGSSISVAKGGKLRSNGVGYAWTYIEPSDTGYTIASDLSAKMPVQNIIDLTTIVAGKGRQSAGAEFTNAGYSYFMAELVGGQVYTGAGPDPSKLMRYACFETAAHAVIAGTGWNGVPTDTFTAPMTAKYGYFTILTDEVSEFQFAKGTVSEPILPAGALRGSNLYLDAEFIIEGPDKKFATQEQLNLLTVSAELSENFERINLADPDNFVMGAVLQSNGVPVTAPSFSHTGNIPVTPGEVMFCNTDANTGFRYACFKQSNGTTVVPSSGWNGVNTTSFTVPSGAAFFDGTFPTANVNSVRVGLGATDPGYIPNDQLYTDSVAFSADAVQETATRKFATQAEKDVISTFSGVNTIFNQLEWKGLLQPKRSFQSPIYDDLNEWIEFLLQGDDDILIEEDNGSISTGVAGYCSATVNSNLLPEFCREENMWTKWVRYMLKRYFTGQKQARFDTAGVFTIGGTVTTTATNNDVNWGHQYPNGSDDFGGPNPTGQVFFDRYYQIITPTSGDASISFMLPDSNYKLAWILSYSHLTGTLTFSVAGGNNRLEYETTTPGVWAELNGATLDTSTPDAFDNVTFTAGGSTSTKIRRDQHSMPFKVRRKEGFTLSGSIAITATMGSGKRIEHWGIYYTRARKLFIPVCSAKGSHALVSLRPFYPYGIDKRRPSLYIMSCPTINEWRVASVEPTDTPTAYAARFTNHIDIVMAKPFIKGIYARIRAFHQGMNIYEASSDMPTYYKTAEGYNSGMDYLNRAIKEMKALKETYPGKLAVANLLQAYLNYTIRLAELNSLTMRNALWQLNGSNPPLSISITMDGTHESNAGTECGWRAEENNWNF